METAESVKLERPKNMFRLFDVSVITWCIFVGVACRKGGDAKTDAVRNEFIQLSLEYTRNMDGFKDILYFLEW